MKNFFLIIGLLSIVYGIYIAILHVKNPARFGRLNSMKRYWGKKLGLVLHFLGYSLIPVTAGVSLILLSIFVLVQ